MPPLFDQLPNLWPALLAMVAANAALFLLTLRFSGRLKPRWRKLLAFLAVILAFTYAWLWADSVWPIRLLPVTNVIILGNFTPLFCAALAGLLAADPALPRRRRRVVAILLGLFIVIAIVHPVLGSRPATHSRTGDEICRQTSESTCSAAAAASLLAAHGIPATEEEMARLCLTTDKGTMLAGLYRGLKIKTRGTPYRVVVSTATLEDLRSTSYMPSILNMRLTAAVAKAEPRYVSQWEWTVGLTHTVLFMGFADQAAGLGHQASAFQPVSGGASDSRPQTSGYVIIGDPSFGKERWQVRAVRDLWSGECVRLVRD